jgi:hypothetical protein
LSASPGDGLAMRRGFRKGAGDGTPAR